LAERREPSRPIQFVIEAAVAGLFIGLNESAALMLAYLIVPRLRRSSTDKGLACATLTVLTALVAVLSGELINGVRRQLQGSVGPHRRVACHGHRDGECSACGVVCALLVGPTTERAVRGCYSPADRARRARSRSLSAGLDISALGARLARRPHAGSAVSSELLSSYTGPIEARVTPDLLETRIAGVAGLAR
jgi:hypothetical protein